MSDNKKIVLDIGAAMEALENTPGLADTINELVGGPLLAETLANHDALLADNAVLTAALDALLIDNAIMLTALKVIAGGRTNEFPGAPDPYRPAQFQSKMWEWSQKVARSAIDNVNKRATEEIDFGTNLE